MRELVDEAREGLLEREAHRVGIDHFSLFDVLVKHVALQTVGLVGHAVKVGFHGVSLEFRTVMELHALAQRHRIDEAVVAHFVVRGECIDHLHVFVEREETFIKGFRSRLRQRIRSVVRIKRRERAGNGHRNFFRRGLRGAGGDKACERERGGCMLQIHFVPPKQVRRGLP